jgi:secondary thiamine-phosphate synthase enzyme
VSEVRCETPDRVGIVDVTESVQSAIGETAEGLAVVSVKHTTAALVVCADEPNLRDDLIRVVTDLLADYRPFGHFQEGKPNGEAHVLSALLGTQVCLPVVGGRLDLGTWQRLLLIELDGPQTRTVHVQLAGAPKEATR